MDDQLLPDRRPFQQVANWCQEYLELQRSREIGQTFGQIVRKLGEIASLPHDGVDRFDWLKQQELEVTRLLRELSKHLAATPTGSVSLSPRIPAVPTDPWPAESTLVRLFVYGTLKRGFSRASAMEGQRFLGAARTLPRYRIHDCGGYPGLVEVDRGEAIEGEVWEVDLACLARLDDIEGVHYRLYARRPIALEPPHAGASVESYFYLRKTTGLPDCGTCWPPRRERPE